MKLVLLYAGAALVVAFVKGIKRNAKDENNNRWGHLRVGSEHRDLNAH